MRFIRMCIRNASVNTIMLLTVILGCADDELTNPNPMVTFDQLWPNDDGHEWFYDLSMHYWHDADLDTLYESADDVPPLPPLSELIELLAAPLPSLLDSTLSLWFSLRFDGMGTTESGMVGQNLVEEFIEPQSTKPLAKGEHFLQRLIAAPPALQNQPLRQELFLHGTVSYEKTTEHIGHYAHVDSLLNWKWLERDLSVGHEFTVQLIPAVVDDVFLHARVLGQKTISVPSGTYANVVEVFYALDYGVSCYGIRVGCNRSVTFGAIAYAPHVGPIYSHQRGWRFASRLLDPNYSGPVMIPFDLTLEHRPRKNSRSPSFSGRRF